MTFRYALKRSIPVMAGYIVLGIGFGMLLGAKGYGITWALAMSVFIYAGSMQYVAIDLITGGASLISAALMTLMVNARHLFYGISMLERYKDTKPYKPYLIFALTDETYSLVCSGGEEIFLPCLAVEPDLLGNWKRDGIGARECIEYQYGRDRFLDDSSVSGGIYGTVDEHEGSQKRRCRCCCIRDLSVDLWGISLSDPVDDLYHGDFDADAWE